MIENLGGFKAGRGQCRSAADQLQPLIHAQHLDAETLTLAPIDVGAMDRSLLTAEELVWLNAYHQRVRETITPLADKETAAWLKDVTRPSQVR